MFDQLSGLKKALELTSPTELAASVVNYFVSNERARLARGEPLFEPAEPISNRVYRGIEPPTNG